MQDQQDERAKMLPAALYYARKGFAVFPVAERGKVPLTEHGVKDASTDAEQIRKWWTQYPTANIGVACGRISGVGVLDIDGPEGEESLARLIAEHGKLVSTLESVTSRGRHLWYWYDPRVRNSAKKIGPGLDTRSDGGYVVAPPSVHESGHVYRWVADRSPRELDAPAQWPQWAIDAFIEAQQEPPKPTSVNASNYAAAALRSEVEKLSSAAEGNRNQALNAAAFSLGQLVSAGALTESEVMAALEGACALNGLIKDDGGVKQVRKTIRSGLQAGMRKPREIPKPRGNEDAEVRTELARLDAAERLAAERLKQATAPTWSEPLPIGRDAAPPAFPLHALPSWIADFVRAEAASVQVPDDMPAAFALGALAAIVGGHVRVRAWDGFEEACNLYIAVAMPPASVKSPVHKHVTAPISRFEQDLQEQAAPAVSAANSRRAVAEKRLRRAEDAAAKATDYKQAMREVDAAREDLEREPVLTLPRLIVDDTTPEQLKTLLALHQGRLAMMSAESALFGNVASTRYSANPNLEAVLAGHSGDELRIDRRDRAEVVRDPRLTICIAIQPAVLRQAHDNQMARERGLFARFLYSIPPSNIGFRDLASLPPEMPSWLREEWDRRIRSIAHAMRQATEVVVLNLSDEARARFQLWRAEHEPKLRPDGELVSVDAWAAKLPGHVLRMAGLLTVAGDTPSSKVSVSTLEAAIELAAYFTAHAQIAFDVMGDDDASANARRVITWIKARGKPSFTRSEITTAFKGRLSAEALTPVLEQLVGLGYLGNPTTQKTSGRPNKSFEVNPKALGNAQNVPNVVPKEVQQTSERNPSLGYRGRNSEWMDLSIYPYIDPSESLSPSNAPKEPNEASLGYLGDADSDSDLPDSEFQD